MIGASLSEHPACAYLNPVSSYDMDEHDNIHNVTLFISCRVLLPTGR